LVQRKASSNHQRDRFRFRGSFCIHVIGLRRQRIADQPGSFLRNPGGDRGDLWSDPGLPWQLCKDIDPEGVKPTSETCLSFNNPDQV
jgi:hypothetical protein